MKYKKLMLVTLLLLAILTIGAVSAVEDTNATLTADNTEELSQDLDDEIISVEETDTQNILESGSATYSNLSDDISESGSIKLKYKNYIYDEGATAITVSEDNKVIDGNGAVIDMKGSTIRAITVSASNVTIKNLTIKNGNYSGDGGAIYFSGSGTVTDCNFNDNSGWNYGGAVYFKSASTLTNCNFTNNQAAGVGGAVYFDNGGELTNCSFRNNTAKYGGAVYLAFDYFAGDSNATIVNCNFINNSATADGGEGGAIRLGGKGTVNSCNFINNTAGKRGGAIYIISGAVENCNFINNTAKNTGHGGAVYFDYSGGNVTNCNFTNNCASDYWGGAVYFYNKGYVNNSNFVGNTADRGGAIYMNSGTVENSNFVDNTAESGGAVNFYTSGEVTNCNFNDNSAHYVGAIVFNKDSSGSVTNCNFTNNKATGDYSYCGAILFTGTGTVTNCNFINNSGTYDSGAIYFVISGTVENCNFINNSASYGGGGAVNFNDAGNVTNCNFINNTAFYYGGAIIMNSGTVTNCNFTNNKATDADATGGAILICDTGTVTNCNFTNNQATGEGGAVSFYYSGIVKKSYFKGNLANNYSDIYCGSELVSENNIFINNTEPEENSTDLVDIANVKITLSKTAFTYNAKVQKPTLTLTNGVVLKEGVDYTLQWPVTSPKNVGTYTVTVIGIGDYTGNAKTTFKINKATNPLAVKAKTVNVKFSAVKKKAQTLSVSKVVTFSKKGQGTLTYAKVNGNKKITINKKTGKVTIKKGLKKGTYKVKVKIKANGNANYKASAFKTITFKIKIK